MGAYTNAFNAIAKCGHVNGSSNKLDAHKSTYRSIRQEMPELPSSLAGYQGFTCEALKALKKKGERDMPETLSAFRGRIV